MDPETIFAALFVKVSSAASFVTKSRRVKHWTDVPADQQPALFQGQRKIGVEQKRGLPEKTILTADIWVYAYSSDPQKSPSQVLNPLVKAVSDALAADTKASDGQMVQTLGLSNVSHCWIEGDIELDEGALGDQAVAIIPVKILAV